MADIGLNLWIRRIWIFWGVTPISPSVTARPKWRKKLLGCWSRSTCHSDQRCVFFPIWPISHTSDFSTSVPWFWGPAGEHAAPEVFFQEFTIRAWVRSESYDKDCHPAAGFWVVFTSVSKKDTDLRAKPHQHQTAWPAPEVIRVFTGICTCAPWLSSQRQLKPKSALFETEVNIPPGICLVGQLRARLSCWCSPKRRPFKINGGVHLLSKVLLNISNVQNEPEPLRNSTAVPPRCCSSAACTQFICTTWTTHQQRCLVYRSAERRFDQTEK